MVPRINARYRRRRGVPYAIEQFSGRQFRCRHCNEVFVTERQFDTHVQRILAASPKSARTLTSKAPELSASLQVRVLYTYDIIDRLKRQWLKLKPGDEYDGM